MALTENSLKETLQRYEDILRDNLLNIQSWRAQGFNSEQIANKLGMTVSNLFILKRRMKDLQAAWKIGDASLLEGFIEPEIRKRAEEGFRYKEITREPEIDNEGRVKLGEDGKPIYRVTKIVEKVQPCSNFLQFMASRLDPGRWGLKKELDNQDEQTELSEEMEDLAE